jgi:hypothetical protein
MQDTTIQDYWKVHLSCCRRGYHIPSHWMVWSPMSIAGNVCPQEAQVQNGLPFSYEELPCGATCEKGCEDRSWCAAFPHRDMISKRKI